MGRLTLALRGVAMPEQTQRKVVSLDHELSEMEAEIQSLKTENLHLRAEVSPLQREVDQLKDRVQKAEERRADELTFSAHTGLYADASGQLFCPTCFHAGEKRIPLKVEAPWGWRCAADKAHYFQNPDAPKPQVRRGGGGGPNSWMGR